MRKILSVLVILLLYAGLAQAQDITEDGTFTTDIETSTATVTTSKAVSAGAGRALVVGFTTRVGSATNHDSCTYNGDSMTKAVEVDEVQFGQLVVSIWYMIAPDVGTANVLCTASTTASWASVGILSLQNVSQSSPLGDTDDVTTPSDVTTIAFDGLTTTQDNSLVFDVFASYNNAGGSMQAETNRTQYVLDSSQGDYFGMSNINPKATAGAVTMQWNIGSTNQAVLVGAEFKAAAVAHGTPTRTDILR